MFGLNRRQEGSRNRSASLGLLEERGGEIGRGKRNIMREKEEGMCGTERVGVGVDGGDERVGLMRFEVKGRKCFLF